MTIQQAGDRWKGADRADLEAFVADQGSDELRVTRVMPVACVCGAERFEVAVGDDQDAARRRCVRCGDERLMLDSAARWDEDDEPAEHACDCEGEVFEVAVGAAPGGRASWAVLVGVRCVECGLLDVVADWDVRAGSAEELAAGV